MKPERNKFRVRRVAPEGSVSADMLTDLAGRVRYAVGPLDNNGHHKLHPGDYRFTPPVAPRQAKSVCDDLRPILVAEALSLFESGIANGMVSVFSAGGTPKYIWAVGWDNEVYEAKTDPPNVVYHGYRLTETERRLRDEIRRMWRQRCATL